MESPDTANPEPAPRPEPRPPTAGSPARLAWLLGGVALVGAHLYHAGAFAFLLDDAYITFRYAQNALAGRGLVFNPGERVEGYSNFLWLIQLIAAGKLGLRPEDSSFLLAILYSLGSLGVALALLRPLVYRRHFAPAALFVLALLAASPTFAVWTTGGLETRSNTFFLLLGLWGTALSARERRGEIRGAVGWAGACLTRPDSLLPFATAALYHLVWTRDWKRSAKLAVPPAVVVAIHYAWRRAYYGDWFPNTYYAKIGEPWWDVGFFYLCTAATECGVWLVAPFAMWATWSAARPGARATLGLFWVATVPHLLYLMRIGGDHFEFRPLDFCWPLLYVAAAVALAQTQLSVRLGSAFGAGARPRKILPIALAAAMAAYSFAIPYAARRAAAGIDSRKDATLRVAPVAPEHLGPLRFLPLSSMLSRMWNDFGAATIPHAVGVRYFEHRINADYLLGLYGEFEGLRARGLIPEDATIATGAVGIVSYYLDIRVVDLYGLTDRTVARTPKSGDGPRLMAHDREPPPGYLDERGVNFERPVVWNEPPESYDDLQDLYFVELDEGRLMSFHTKDPEWAESRFEGRIVRRPTGKE